MLTLSGTAGGHPVSLVSDGHGGTEIPQTSSNDNARLHHAEIRAIDVGRCRCGAEHRYVINIDGPISLTSDLLAINWIVVVADYRRDQRQWWRRSANFGRWRQSAWLFCYAGTVTLENLTIQNMWR